LSCNFEDELLLGFSLTYILYSVKWLLITVRMSGTVRIKRTLSNLFLVEILICESGNSDLGGVDK